MTDRIATRNSPHVHLLHPDAPNTTVRQYKRLLGLNTLDCSLIDAAEHLLELANSETRHNIFFVNAHCVNVATKDANYSNILKRAPFVFADGSGMAIAARIHGIRLLHNLNGTDLFPLICSVAARRQTPIAFLGAAPNLAKACARRMTEKYPGLTVAYTGNGYMNDSEERKAIDDLNASGARLLFVAKGVPLQEHWMEKHRRELTIPVVLGVGALFDFYSENVPRAPIYVRRLGCEWIYRLLREPRRMFRRYVIGNPWFLFRVISRRHKNNER